MENTLVILLGPTGVGKTDFSIELAKKFNSQIISSDSRQFYKDLKIGVATPSVSQLNEVKHHLIGQLDLQDYYNVHKYEQDVLQILEQLFKASNVAFLVGGSGMYIDVVCKGIDDLPDVEPELRNNLLKRFEVEGIESLRMQLKSLDPVFYNQVDLMNHKRILKALEVCIGTGKPYSSFRKNELANRNFNIVKIGLNRERQDLYDRINLRVDHMFKDGLEEEARSVYPFKGLNSLNTVGYKELFEHFDGNISFEKAKELIKRNSRRYAKRQLTWWGRDKDITWFHPEDKEQILQFLEKKLY